MSGPITNLADADAVAVVGALPVPQGPEPQALSPVQGMALAEFVGDVKPATTKLLLAFGECVRDCREHEHPEASEDFHCLNLTAWMGERAGLVLRRLLDAEAENARLRSQVAALLKERQSTNEALDDAVQALRAGRNRVAEVEQGPALPWAHAMPDDDLHGFLGDLVSAAMGRWQSSPEVPDREVLAAVERACAAWRTPGQGYRSDEPEADSLTRAFVPVASLREDDEFHLRHTYRVGRDLPETGGPR